MSAFAWQFAFDINTGFVNSWFAWLPGIGADTDWFGDKWTSLLVICLAEIWKTTPFISLLLLAGLAQVPDVLQEAAQVDGATWWQRLWRVTIPNMKAAIMVALLFRTLDAFRIFDSIFIMTAGANGTESVSFLAYRQTIARSRSASGRRSRSCCSSRRAHRLRLHQGLQGRPVPGAGGVLMSTT